MNKNFVTALIFFLATTILLSEWSEPVEIAKLKNSSLREVSGIVMSRINEDLFWMHNDSGDPPLVYGVNLNGEIVIEIELKGAENRDWEDISIGPGPIEGKSYIYISETGDNDSRYDEYSILRFEEPLIKSYTQDFMKIDNYQICRFKYSDGKSHDCETMFVDPESRDIYLLTKRDEKSLLFEIPYPQKFYDHKDQQDAETDYAEFLLTTNLGKFADDEDFSMIVGADIASDGNRIVIKSYDSVYVYSRDLSMDVKAALKTQPEAFRYQFLNDPQCEAICFGRDSYDLYTVGEEVVILGKKMGRTLYHLAEKPSNVTEDIEGEGYHFSLNGAYPDYEIEFFVPVSTYVKISLYDSRGAKVFDISSEHYYRGMNRVGFSASTLFPGVYAILMRADNFTRLDTIVISN